MKPNHLLLIILLSSAAVFASEISSKKEIEEEISSFKNFPILFPRIEEAVMLDKLKKPPRVSRTEYVGVKADFNSISLYDQVSYREYLNSLNAGDTEDEDEAEELVKAHKVNDRLYLTMCDDESGSMTDNTLYDFNEELFKAAVDSGNVDRLRELLKKNKHKLLTSKQKARAFKLALIACNGRKDSAVFGEIFRSLLDYGFYPEDEYWPSIYGSDNKIYPLRFVFRDPLLYQPFLDYDKDFFARKRRVSYIINLIKGLLYSDAVIALRLGFDPWMAFYGRNALDWALDVPCRVLEAEEEVSRQALITAFQNYGMMPSNTIDNFILICGERGVDWNRAIQLVRLGGMEFRDISPIGLAFLFNNVELVRAAIEMYIYEISDQQARSDLDRYCPNSVRDPNRRALLDQAAEQVRTLKHLD